MERVVAVECRLVDGGEDFERDRALAGRGGEQPA
jgi:hypothetical protein